MCLCVFCKSTPPPSPTTDPSLPQEVRQSVGQVQSVLVKKLSVLDKYEHILSQVNAVAMERLIDPKTQVNIQLVCEDPAILAQQLTHIEMVRAKGTTLPMLTDQSPPLSSKEDCQGPYNLPPPPPIP